MGFPEQTTYFQKILITKPELNGKTLAQLKIRNNFGASITRVNRSGVDLVATPNLQLQMGDRVKIVGSELAVAHAEKILGNSMKRLNHQPDSYFLRHRIRVYFRKHSFFIPRYPSTGKTGTGRRPPYCVHPDKPFRTTL